MAYRSFSDKTTYDDASDAVFFVAGAAGATVDRPAGSTHAAVTIALAKRPGANATAVADYFVSILFPAEGKANLDLYRNAAVAFLNTDDTGTASSPFSGLGNTNTTYDTRVRGMVSLLMTTQRFQEQ